jgi:hypothetical protein
LIITRGEVNRIELFCQILQFMAGFYKTRSFIKEIIMTEMIIIQINIKKPQKTSSHASEEASHPPSASLHPLSS